MAIRRITYVVANQYPPNQHPRRFISASFGILLLLLVHLALRRITYVVANQYTDKKENQIFLIYKEIQSGAVAKSYLTNGLLIYMEIFTHFLIY